MINVNNEWGELREVVVGNIGQWTEIHPDFSFRLYYQDNLKNVFLEKSIKLQQKVILQRQEDLDNMAKTLESEGIKVFRPLPLERLMPFETPDFKDWPSPCHNPRDQFLILGDQIIETSCQWRKRYFENDLLKPVLMEQWRQGAHWVSSPRPLMTEGSFDLTHLKTHGGVDLEGWVEDEEKLEIMFDGAQCLKFDRDIVMNVRTKNHWLAYEWLKRHLKFTGDKYRLHPVELTDNHIDGMMMPLAPGKLLINSGSMPGKLDQLPDFLKSWEIIKAPDVSKEVSGESEVKLASQHININVLPLSPQKTLIFDDIDGRHNQLGDLLAKHSIEALPIRMRHCRLFDGGVHCASLCLNRDD
jgi:glycine amidinotransferase